MEIAKVSDKGIELPKDFKIPSGDYVVKRLGKAMLWIQEDALWETFMEGVNGFTDDFMADGRYQGVLEEREPL